MAGQAEQTAAQAAASVAAYEAAFAATVPPPVIAANRSQLASLVASNVLGQNTPAIAATEAEYGQMWVQDAAAMYGYAGRAAAAAAVTPFSQPSATTNPAGMGSQSGAVAQSSAGSAQSQLSQLINAIPQALHGLSSAAPPPVQPTPPPAVVPSMSQIASYVEAAARTILPANDAIILVLFGLAQFARNLTIDLDFAAANAAAADLPTHALASAESAGGGIAPAVSAGSGHAGLVGKLSVPPGWTETAPEAKLAAAALPGTSAGAAPAAAIVEPPGVPGGLFAVMALAGLIGRGIGGSALRSSPAAVMNGHASGRLERMVTELAGTHEVQHWHVDPSRLDSLLEELAEKPGVHAVHVNDDGRGKFELPPQPGQDDRPRA
jgi:PPE-repeat protein